MKFINTVYAKEAAAAAEGAESSGGVLQMLGIDGSLFIFQFINFAIIASIIWFLILKPLTSKIIERQKMIDEGLENARRSDAMMKNVEAKKLEILDAAKAEAAAILEKAYDESKQTADDTKTKTKAEVDLLISQAKKNIEIQREEMVDQIKRESLMVVFAALEKALSKKVTDELDKKFIHEVLEEIDEYEKVV